MALWKIALKGLHTGDVLLSTRRQFVMTSAFPHFTSESEKRLMALAALEIHMVCIWYAP